MRILLVANYAIDRQFSMIRYADVLQRELAKRGHFVEQIAPRAALFPNRRRNDGFWKWVGYVDKFLIFPFRLRSAADGFDIVHVCDHGNAMYVFWLGRKRHIITAHDLIAIRAARGMGESSRPGWAGRTFQSLILAGLRRAQHVVCVSDQTRQYLLELEPAMQGRSEVVANGLNFDFRTTDPAERAPTLRKLGLDDVPYFLHVGAGMVHKNRAFLVRLFAAMKQRRPEMPHVLVLAGAEVDDADIASTLGDCAIAASIRQVGIVSNEELRDLYGGATALIFPSLMEGFGWPIVEAQSCACPVFATDRRPMTDVGGPAARYFDPCDHEAAAELVLESMPALVDMRSRSLVNAARYTASAMAAGYQAAYLRALHTDQDLASQPAAHE